MTTISEWASTLLHGTELSQKLAPVQLSAELGTLPSFVLPKNPGRSQRLSFSEAQVKFPKRGSFDKTEARAIALHSFANHELLAIEMMAAALLSYPQASDEDQRVKRGIVAAIRDEQKHLALYVKRLNDLGYEFGDFPLNSFFWRQMEKLPTAAHFFGLMSLTFESANLDFSLVYEDVFRQVGDEETAKILRVVHDDEIGHVALGAYWLARWKGERRLWDYYRALLPEPLTPARAKGNQFHAGPRIAAGLPKDWVTELEQFKDDFRITNRRSWA